MSEIVERKKVHLYATQWIRNLNQPLDFFDDFDLKVRNITDTEHLKKFAQAISWTLFQSRLSDDIRKMLNLTLSKVDAKAPQFNNDTEVSNYLAANWLFAEIRITQKEPDNEVPFEELDPEYLENEEILNLSAVFSLLLQEEVTRLLDNSFILKDPFYLITLGNSQTLLLCILRFCEYLDEMKEGFYHWCLFSSLGERLPNLISVFNHTLKNRRQEFGYIGSALRASVAPMSEPMKFVTFVSLIELLLVHEPRNYKDSISRQFNDKLMKILILNNPNINLDAERAEIKEIYKVRSAIAHGNFALLNEYTVAWAESGNPLMFKNEQLQYWIKNIIELILYKPKFIEDLKDA